MPYGELFHGHTMAMVCRHRWWPVSNWGPPRENHSCSHSTWLLSFALSLPRSCPHYSLVQSPSLLLFLSYSSRFSFSLLITSDTRIRSFLFSLSNPHVDTIYLPFNIVSAIRFISQYSYLSVFPSFSHRISLPAPSVSLPSLSLSLIFPPSLFVSILNPRFIPSRLFVFTPIKSCSFFALESPNPVYSLRSSLFVVYLSFSFSLSLPISRTLVPTTSVNFPTARTDQSYRWPSIRASQSLTSVFYCGFLNHFYACIPSARARTKYCTERNNTLCVRPYESRTKRVWCVSSTRT